MRKNNSNSISYNKYRAIDLTLFAVILFVSEVCVFIAANAFKSEAFYTLSFILPISCIVIVRWGWVGIIYAVAGAALHCLLSNANGEQYLIYCVGALFIAFGYLAMLAFNRKKMVKSIYISLAFYAISWVALNLGRSIMAAIVGKDFLSSLITCCGMGDSGALTLIVGAVLIFVLKRLDGMWEGQRDYLLRLEKDRQDRQKRDTYGDEPIEIDEHSMSVLKKDTDDMFE